MSIKPLIITPIGGLAGYLTAYYLYPIIGLWFIPPCLLVGFFIGWFGSELLHRLGIK